jgi:two-component system cell cycle response regulator
VDLVNPTSGRRTDNSQPILRALIVEDDPDYRTYVSALLKRVGFSTDSAGDGEAALDRLLQTRYDVVVIDQEMPRMTGVELVTLIRAAAETRGIYAVMLTGTDGVAAKLTALDAGFDDFLTKGFSEAEIVAKLVAARRLAVRQRTLDVEVRELYRLAMRDELTGLFNRRFFLEEAGRLLALARRVSVVLFDLDDFKRINDTFGHVAGDAVLRDIGALFQRHTRPEDLIARYGGDEFVMIVADLDPPQVGQIAARLAEQIGELRWAIGNQGLSIRATIGFASSDGLPDRSVPLLLQAADRTLYRNKWMRGTPGAKAAAVAPADADAPRLIG